MRKKNILTLLSLFFLLFIPILIFADPPTPHSISGFIFFNDSTTQVPLATKYYALDNESNTFVFSQTSLPIPGYSGYYAVTLSGVNQDNVTLRAWNDSMYGERFIVLFGVMNDINFTLNQSRPPEPTVNITSHQNNLVLSDRPFSLISDLYLHGSAAENCSTSISFSNSSILDVKPLENSTYNLGYLPLAYSNSLNWDLMPLAIGTTNVTVNFSCSGQGIKFENLKNFDIVFNITINDSTPPNISLISPLNGSWIDFNVSFRFNTSDISDLTNCSLFVDESYRNSIDNPEKGKILELNDSFLEGTHMWNVSCKDIFNLTGYSSTFYFVIGGIRTLFTDKTSYLQGENILITGHNWSDGPNVLNLTLPDFSNYLWFTNAQNGQINTNYALQYSSLLGIYNLSAYQNNSKNFNATANFIVNLRTQSIETDKYTYNENELVFITGYNFSIYGTLNLTMYHNNSKSKGPGFPVQVQANQTGDFNYTWNVSDICSGVYYISTNDQNYTDYNETIYFNLSKQSPCFSWEEQSPIIFFIQLSDGFFPVDKIDLLAGQSTKVFCNISVRDANGFKDISFANATLHYYLNKSTELDDNNTHYTNHLCSSSGNNSIDETYFLCEFNVSYYANNGSWMCNATVTDLANLTDYSNDSSRINELLAIRVIPFIDFGNVLPGQNSSEITSFVTNAGNVEADIGLHAYAVKENDGFAMNCTYSTIGLTQERYSLDNDSGTFFDLMTSVSSTIDVLSDFNLSKKINESDSIKNIYWRLRPPIPSAGKCNGSVVFTAIG